MSTIVSKRQNVFLFTQAEILEKVGPDALRLGLLMGTEDDPSEEEQQEVLSFHHLTFMEFAAGKYISTLTEVSQVQYIQTEKVVPYISHFVL